MSDIRLVIAGAAGRMGRAVALAALKTPGVKLHAGLSSSSNPAQGKDLATLVGHDAVGAVVSADPLAAIAKADAVIDFTTPAVSLELADLCAQARIVHVIGTTGFEDSAGNRLAAAARHATIVKSSNFSLGVNMLAGLVELAARALGPDFDVEILELHHRRKVDAPSGTALLLGEAAARGHGRALADTRLKPRDGIGPARATGPIGFASLRGGTVIGEHGVFMAGEGERIELWHKAEDRSIFAIGALKAALWGQGKGPGLFDMQDVLGLRAR